MHHKRNLVLLVLPVMLAASVSATSASAAEVVTEATGVHCSAITENDAPATPEVAGGCPVRGVANDLEFGGPFGLMLICDFTAEGKVNETGAGIGLRVPDAGGCESNESKSECTGPGDTHASTSALTGAASPYTFFANFCVVALGLTNRCVGLPGTLNEGAGHTYSAVFVHTNKCQNGVNSVQGTFVQVIDAAHPKAEVR